MKAWPQTHLQTHSEQRASERVSDEESGMDRRRMKERRWAVAGDLFALCSYMELLSHTNHGSHNKCWTQQYFVIHLYCDDCYIFHSISIPFGFIVFALYCVAWFRLVRFPLVHAAHAMNLIEENSRNFPRKIEPRKTEPYHCRSFTMHGTFLCIWDSICWRDTVGKPNCASCICLHERREK